MISNVITGACIHKLCGEVLCVIHFIGEICQLEKKVHLSIFKWHVVHCVSHINAVRCTKHRKYAMQYSFYGNYEYKWHTMTFNTNAKTQQWNLK